MVKRFYRSGKWRRLRRTTLIKDRYRCQRCGKAIRGYDANVHHRVPRLEDEELSLEPLNLLSLCRSCHSIIHALDRLEQQPLLVANDGSPLDPDHHWNSRGKGKTRAGGDSQK